jgi:predicted nuclease with TOPRIM domain
MLNQQDLDQIEKIIDEKLDEKLKLLPAKDELFERLDEIVGELKSVREEQAAMAGRLSNHEDRLEQLEEIHPNNAHPLAAKPA